MINELKLMLDGEDKFSSLSPYLQAAYLAISVAARPIGTREILATIDRFGFHENAISGSTPQKTMNARLSENIIQYGENSVFCRTGPDTFSLRHLEHASSLLTPYERNRHLSRQKRVTSENVLVANYDDLKQRIPGPFAPYPETRFEQFEDICYFKYRPEAEHDTSVKQFVTYSLLHQNGNFLVFRRGRYSNPSDHLRDTYSIAFGGHVTDLDFSLFSGAESAFLHNSSRELFEELDLPSAYDGVDKVSANSKIVGFINVDDNSDARQHVAVVIAIDYSHPAIPKSGELGIRDVHWCDLDDLQENRNAFDLWSQFIIDRLEDEVIHV